MQKERIVTKYSTNKKVKEKIDKLLHKNSIIQSNLGSDTTQEEKDIAKEKIKDIAYEIYNICPIFAKENFLEVEFKDIL